MKIEKNTSFQSVCFATKVWYSKQLHSSWRWEIFLGTNGDRKRIFCFWSNQSSEFWWVWKWWSFFREVNNFVRNLATVAHVRCLGGPMGGHIHSGLRMAMSRDRNSFTMSLRVWYIWYICHICHLCNIIQCSPVLDCEFEKISLVQSLFQRPLHPSMTSINCLVPEEHLIKQTAAVWVKKTFSLVGEKWLTLRLQVWNLKVSQFCLYGSMWHASSNLQIVCMM